MGCMITSDGSVIEHAADMGITYFDTARMYQKGNNERMVGAALKRKRKDIVLSTKTEGKDKAEALEQLDTSLKELGTDYLDVWYLHGKDKIEDVNDDLIEAQQIAIKAGKVRFAGVSTHQRAMLPFLAKHEKIDVVLANYNFTMEPEWTAAMEEVAKAGKGVVAMKVMAGGLGRGRGGAANPNAERFKQPGAMAAVYRWVTRNPNVHTTIPSMTDIEQVAENIRAGVATVRSGRREAAGGAQGADPSVLLQRVREVRGRLPEGSAGGQHVAVRDLCRRLRAVRPGPRALPGVERRTRRRAMRRVRVVHGHVSARGPRGGSTDARAGTFRLLRL